jgi:hypothetical protein
MNRLIHAILSVLALSAIAPSLMIALADSNPVIHEYAHFKLTSHSDSIREYDFDSK